jgi:hypothetical protein
MSLDSVVMDGVKEINRASGNGFRPDRSRLVLDLSRASSDTSGVIAVPSKNSIGYEVLRLSAPSHWSRLIDGIGLDLWECAKRHYGLTGAVLLVGAGGVPVHKSFLGHQIHPGASKYTNIISDMGLKFFPRFVLPSGTAAARIAKKTVGTIRVFGIIGRTFGYGAIALGMIDAVVIGKCAYDARHGR